MSPSLQFWKVMDIPDLTEMILLAVFRLRGEFRHFSGHIFWSAVQLTHL